MTKKSHRQTLTVGLDWKTDEYDRKSKNDKKWNKFIKTKNLNWWISWWIWPKNNFLVIFVRSSWISQMSIPHFSCIKNRGKFLGQHWALWNWAMKNTMTETHCKGLGGGVEQPCYVKQLVDLHMKGVLTKTTNCWYCHGLFILILTGQRIIKNIEHCLAFRLW